VGFLVLCATVAALPVVQPHYEKLNNTIKFSVGLSSNMSKIDCAVGMRQLIYNRSIAIGTREFLMNEEINDKQFILAKIPSII
jgi:hypothetical protein